MGVQQDILINWSPQETRVAIVENGAVQELHVERTLERGLVGNVYLGSGDTLAGEGRLQGCGKLVSGVEHPQGVGARGGIGGHLARKIQVEGMAIAL